MSIALHLCASQWGIPEHPTVAQSSRFNCLHFDMGSVEGSVPDQHVRLQGVLLTPRSLHRNPHLDTAHAHNVKWAVEVGLISNDAKAVEALDQTRFVGVTATSLHDRPAEDLEIVADCVAFFVIFDDIWDKSWKQLQLDSSDLRRAIEVLLDILRGKYKTLAEVPSLKFPRHAAFNTALFDIRHRLERKQVDLQHFISSVERYFYGCAMGFQNRIARLPMTEGTYLLVRTFTIGVQTIFELCVALGNVRISDAFRKDPLMELMTTTAIHILTTQNDIVSVVKELKEESVESMVFLRLAELESRYGRASTEPPLLLEAFNSTVSRYNNDMQVLMAIEDLLPKGDEAARAYYTILLDQIRDNVDWYFGGTIRYGLPEATVWLEHPWGDVR